MCSSIGRSALDCSKDLGERALTLAGRLLRVMRCSEPETSLHAPEVRALMTDVVGNASSAWSIKTLRKEKGVELTGPDLAGLYGAPVIAREDAERVEESRNA